MLMERREQALEERNDITRKMAQNEAIQQDLDELHRILDPALFGIENVKHIDSIDFADTGVENLRVHDAPIIQVYSPDRIASQDIIVEKKTRSKTPTFPFQQKAIDSERCFSPYPVQSPLNTLANELSNGTVDVDPHLEKFANDSLDLWYKPNMSREEAVCLLRHMEPGTFLIRSSTTYRDAFGLVLRVAKAPPNMVSGAGYGDQLVRHFLLEPTTQGVRLKGCTNEPIFTSLSAFVYEHSINEMALPCTLKLPTQDLVCSRHNQELLSKQRQLLVQGAACNVLYLYQCDMESLTGNNAVRKAVLEMYLDPKRLVPLEVHLKISREGITLTDNTRTRFFRRHYPAINISHFGIDPNNNLWSVNATDEGLQRAVKKSIFAFIARPLSGSKDNQCHIFCDLSSMQPASAIISFAHKVLSLNKSHCKME
ncbi:by [Drosophila busckii]|uniref:By n=1 Tax=Drosophila busckii TaxID=30019 RepID=A0A0M5J2S5_DROBS|nr:by [Drosophila busckii]